jgi:hypothetical protein
MGPKHTAGFALFAAAGMIAITLLVVGFALPQIDWRAPATWARCTTARRCGRRSSRSCSRSPASRRSPTSPA